MLEEEESISEGECEKFKKHFDGLPDDFDLPVDDTGGRYTSSTCFDVYSMYTLLRMRIYIYLQVNIYTMYIFKILV